MRGADRPRHRARRGRRPVWARLAGSSTSTSRRRCRRRRSRRGSRCGTAFNRRAGGHGRRAGRAARATWAPPTGWTRCSTRSSRCAMDCGMPPLAQPVGGILAAQAVRHVLVGAPLGRGLGRDARLPVRRVRHAAATSWRRRRRPSPSTAARPPETIDLDRLRAEGSRRQRGGPAAGGAVRRGREPAAGGAARRAPTVTRRRRDGGFDRGEAARIRELIDMVETSDVGELTIEDHGVKITVRRQDDRRAGRGAGRRRRRAGRRAPAAEPTPASVSTVIKIESPMVGTFYRSPSPDGRRLRRRGRPGRGRADAVHARGDEAVQRVQGRARRRDPARSWSRTPSLSSTASRCSSSSR